MVLNTSCNLLMIGMSDSILFSLEPIAKKSKFSLISLLERRTKVFIQIRLKAEQMTFGQQKDIE